MNTRVSGKMLQIERKRKGGGGVAREGMPHPSERTNGVFPLLDTGPMRIPIPIPMATVLNTISVPIRRSYIEIVITTTIRIGPSGAFLHIIKIGVGIGVGQWKHTIGNTVAIGRCASYWNVVLSILYLFSFWQRYLCSLTRK